MDAKYQLGQSVRVRSSQGILTRVVVEDLGKIVTICRSEELSLALDQHRDPHAIGFLRADILNDC